MYELLWVMFKSRGDSRLEMLNCEAFGNSDVPGGASSKQRPDVVRQGWGCARSPCALDTGHEATGFKDLNESYAEGQCAHCDMCVVSLKAIITKEM